jgi:hypothetical protein
MTVALEDQRVIPLLLHSAFWNVGAFVAMLEIINLIAACNYRHCKIRPY